MPVTRNSAQSNQTLEEFYRELGNENDVVGMKMGAAMLAFIDMMNQTIKETPLWGLTSISNLVIQAENDWKSPWFIRVSTSGKEFIFEYLLPEEEAPWPNATARGVARSIDEAKKFLLIAMHRCGGWKNNSELHLLLKEQGITL